MEFKQKVLPVNESQYSIMGVKFSSNKKYRAALYAISSNMIEGWTPAKEDVELIKKQTDEIFEQYKKK